ncbi:MAG: flagellar hook-associated protein FlgK, partial [Clostridiaceae bacterium]|nr:flagellar hook-associated protein FlgK [Clostridiaceae bacterium]
MGVGFASYEIARSGLTVNERGLYVTGHNISNVNTPGYVRQQAMIKNGPVESYYTRAGLMQYGLGSDIQDIRQIRHVFLDNVFRQENTTLGYWESRRKTFQDVEAIMAEPIESGLQNMLNNFWDSWQELSKEPESLTVRALVRQRSEALVQHINHMGEQLDRLQSDLNTEIAVRIDEVNEITRQIASLNVTILRNEINSDSANDYRDQRNSLIDRLTKLVKADVNEMQDGQVDISVGGYFLVQKGVSRDLYAAERNAGENFYVAKLAGTNTEVPLNSGIIKGLMESRGEVSGAIGSYENGAPNTNVDVVFYVDTSTMSAAEAATRMNIYSQWLSDRGLNANVMMREVGSA